jgi:hypothetical protein
MEEKIVSSSLFQHIEKDQLQLHVFFTLLPLKGDVHKVITL